MEPAVRDIEAIYRRRGVDFYRLALARTGDPESARDAVQEGFANALASRRSYRGSGSLEAWLARCVSNAAHDLRRGTMALSATADGGTEDCSASERSLDSPEANVRDAIRRLPPRRRDVLFLRFYLGLDYAAIAEALGVEVGTVSAALHSARASLAATLKEVPT